MNRAKSAPLAPVVHGIQSGVQAALARAESGGWNASTAPQLPDIARECVRRQDWRSAVAALGATWGREVALDESGFDALSPPTLPWTRRPSSSVAPKTDPPPSIHRLPWLSLILANASHAQMYAHHHPWTSTLSKLLARWERMWERVPLLQHKCILYQYFTEQTQVRPGEPVSGPPARQARQRTRDPEGQSRRGLVVCVRSTVPTLQARINSA